MFYNYTKILDPATTTHMYCVLLSGVHTCSLNQEDRGETSIERATKSIDATSEQSSDAAKIFVCLNIIQCTM